LDYTKQHNYDIPADTLFGTFSQKSTESFFLIVWNQIINNHSTSNLS